MMKYTQQDIIDANYRTLQVIGHAMEDDIIGLDIDLSQSTNDLRTNLLSIFDEKYHEVEEDNIDEIEYGGEDEKKEEIIEDISSNLCPNCNSILIELGSKSHCSNCGKMYYK